MLSFNTCANACSLSLCSLSFSLFSHLHASDYDAYIQRLRERVPEEKGISFEDFKQFCQFLNNLDDFSIAMRMYTFAGQ